MHLMKLVIPPPILGLITGLGIWGVSQLALLQLTFIGQKPIAIVFIACGVLIELIAVAAFFRAKTTVNPLRPDTASKLVVQGLYHYTRNPMYLGLVVVLLGWTVWLGNPFGLGLVAVFVWYMTVFQIKPEEAALKQLFGVDYAAYCQRVRRWV